MSGTLTQAPKRGTSRRAATYKTTSSDHLIHIPRAPRGTTPNILRAATVAAGVLALIAAVVLTGSSAGARSKISSVGGTDAPSVRATDNFLFQLQDMDAQLVNALLVNGDPSVHVPRAVSEANYAKDRSAADGDLENATTALAGDPKALQKLHDVTDAYGQYQAQAARTLAVDERDGGTVAGRAPASVFTAYQAGHDILFGADDQAGLMKAASDLEGQSAAAIDASASSVDSSLTTVTVEFLVFGAVLVGGLVVLQVFLFRRFRRVLNPALAAATVAGLVLMIGGAVGASSASTDFHTAKADAFDSVLALSKAKAVSSGINTDESRWLLAHDQQTYAQRFEDSFLAGESQIAGVPRTHDILTYGVGLKEELAQRTPDNLAETGLAKYTSFGDEFRNITFPTEGDKALAAFSAYNTYIQDDANLRTLPLDTPDRLKAAIDFDTNADTPGTSDQTFNAFSKALDEVIAVNESHFESSVPAAKNGIGIWAWLPYVLALLLIGLTVLGLRPRLNEYR